MIDSRHDTSPSNVPLDLPQDIPVSEVDPGKVADDLNEVTRTSLAHHL
jgi:hypothetical protein